MTFQKVRATQLAGDRADQPDAATVAEGTLYFVVDEQLVERSDGAAWVEVLAGGGGTYDSRAVPYVADTGTPGTGALTGDRDNLSYRSDDRSFGVNTPNGHALVPCDVYGNPVDIGYLLRIRPIGTGSAYIQTQCIGANDAAGFTFDQNSNSIAWRMAVIGNGGNAMRWTVIDISGGGFGTRHAFWVTTNANLILSADRDEVTTGRRCLVIANDVAPTAVAANTVAVYAEDVSSSSELKVINEAGEVTVLSGDLSLPSGKQLQTDEVLIRSSTFALRSNVNMANGAGASSGTLTNAPAAGNPTKWIPFDDNGTTRHFPCW